MGAGVVYSLMTTEVLTQDISVWMRVLTSQHVTCHRPVLRGDHGITRESTWLMVIAGQAAIVWMGHAQEAG